MNQVDFRSNDDICRNIFGNSESEPGNQGSQSLMRWVHDWPIGYFYHLCFYTFESLVDDDHFAIYNPPTNLVKF